MTEGESRHHLQSHRLTYCLPSPPQLGGTGREKLMTDALSFVQTVPRMSLSTSPTSAQEMRQHLNRHANDGCSCERRSKNILCQACGHVFSGRIRATCPQHPTTIHLMDIACCPECQGNHLKEFSDCTMKRD